MYCAFFQYQGTYVPGGGDIAVGQELTDADKGLDDGIEGEVFGFNMVDEAVDIKDQAVFLNPSNKLGNILMILFLIYKIVGLEPVNSANFKMRAFFKQPLEISFLINHKLHQRQD